MLQKLLVEQDSLKALETLPTFDQVIMQCVAGGSVCIICCLQ